MQATNDFHNCFDIPDGSIFKLEVSGIVGNVQGDASFLSGSGAVADQDWTLAQIENGKASSVLGGPGLTIVRARLTLDQGATVQVDMFMEDADGNEIANRRRTWNLSSPDSNRTGHIGYLIDVNGPVAAAGAAA